MMQTSMIWLIGGPAHFQCWVDKINKAPIAKPLPFNPTAIYPDYRDAMTGTKLAPLQIYNRVKKRQFFTLDFDRNYLPSGAKQVAEKIPYPNGDR